MKYAWGRPPKIFTITKTINYINITKLLLNQSKSNWRTNFNSRIPQAHLLIEMSHLNYRQIGLSTKKKRGLLSIPKTAKPFEFDI